MSKVETGMSASSFFLVLLAIALIVLKLCNVITCSWWWVLAPVWIPFALIILRVIIAIIALIILGR